MNKFTIARMNGWSCHPLLSLQDIIQVNIEIETSKEPIKTCYFCLPVYNYKTEDIEIAIAHSINPFFRELARLNLDDITKYDFVIHNTIINCNMYISLEAIANFSQEHWHVPSREDIEKFVQEYHKVIQKAPRG